MTSLPRPSDLQLIGLSGKSGSGKSTATAYLRSKGYEPATFTEVLKEVAQRVFDL